MEFAELGKVSFRILELGELGETRFRLLELGELGEASLKSMYVEFMPINQCEFFPNFPRFYPKIAFEN